MRDGGRGDGVSEVCGRRFPGADGSDSRPGRGYVWVFRAFRAVERGVANSSAVLTACSDTISSLATRSLSRRLLSNHGWYRASCSSVRILVTVLPAAVRVHCCLLYTSDAADDLLCV